MEYWFGWFIILKNGWWNVIFSIRKESWTVDHFLSRPLHTHHRLHIIQATSKESVFDFDINIQKHACKKENGSPKSLQNTNQRQELHILGHLLF